MASENMDWINEEKRIAITDDYMFGYVMRQLGVCTRVIKCLLPDIPAAEVKFADEVKQTADTQKTIQGNMGNHSVRLDVYLDDGRTIFNVEMQTGNKTNLPKRARYYGGYMTYVQAQMDARNEGIAIGEARGIVKTLIELVKDGVISVKDASKRANMSEKEFAALIAVQ